MALDDQRLPNWVFALGPFGIGIALVIYVVARDYIRRLLASNWSLTQGYVESGAVVKRVGRSRSFFEVTMQYSYAAHNEYYSGEFMRVFDDEGSADQFVNSLKGQTILVRTNPNRPDKSTLLKQDQPAGWPSQ